MELIYLKWLKKYIKLLESGFEYNECAVFDKEYVIKDNKEEILDVESGNKSVSIEDVDSLFEAYEDLLLKNQKSYD